MKKYFRKAIYLLVFPFLWVACLNKSIKALHVFTQVEKLEREENYEEAKKLRKTWLLKLPSKYTGPLWRQEGYDLLYRQDDYERSLKAFENAIKSLDENPAHYGVADPMQIYYGATVSSIKLDLKDKAKMYFKEALSIYERFSKNEGLRSSMSKYDKGIVWAKEQLEIET